MADAPPPPLPGSSTLLGLRQQKKAGRTVKDKSAAKVTPLWKTRICEFWQVAKCRKGAACSFAHGEDDLRPSPDFERTSVCPVFLHHGKCDRPQCRYAHSVDELRVAQNMLKSKMCSFFLIGRCVVGPACRFAHSEEELEEANAVISQVPVAAAPGLQGPRGRPEHGGRKPRPPGPLEKFLTPSTLPSEPKRVTIDPIAVAAPSLQEHGEDAHRSNQADPMSDWPEVTVAPDEPLKVVIAASWADDLLQEPSEAVSSLKNRPAAGPGPPPARAVPAKRSRARRVLVDTLADLDDFPTEIISSIAAAKEQPGGLIQVNGSPGLVDLNSRHRESVIVLDIEDGQEICKDGFEKFQQANQGVNLVEIRRRKARASVRQEAEPRSRSLQTRRRPEAALERRSPSRHDQAFERAEAEPPACARAREACPSEACAREDCPKKCEGDVAVPESWQRRDRGNSDCAICSGSGCSRGERLTPCAACNCGLRVVQQNTFLTVDEEDDEFLDFPLRRTKSL